MKLNAFKECQELELKFFQCPSTLFILSGFFTIILIISTYILARLYYSDEIVFFLSIFIALFMLIVSYLVHSGTTKAADSKRKLKETNLKIQEAYNKLRQAEKMQQEFTHMMVHDLRSPLNGIRMLAELLSKETAGKMKKNFDEPLHLIKENSKHMLGMVNDLLDLAKIEAGMFKLSKEELDLSSFVQESIKYFSPLSKSKRISIKFIAEENLPEVFFDKKAMRQVFENLLSNSLKFTNDNGMIEIGIFKHIFKRNIIEEAQKIHLNWYLKGGDDKLNLLNDSLIVSITDNGSGISLNNLSRLFNKFEQMKNAHETHERGTGLGLVIVKGIIEAHQGNIGVSTKEGIGSTFYFNLPL